MNDGPLDHEEAKTKRQPGAQANANRPTSLDRATPTEPALAELVTRFADFTAAFLTQFPTASEVVRTRLVQCSNPAASLLSALQVSAPAAPSGKPASQEMFMVYETAADFAGVVSSGPIDSASVGRRFRQRIHEYEVFIDCGCAWIRPPADSVAQVISGLSPLDVRLLTVFLIHKDRVIDTGELFSQARSQRCRLETRSTQTILMEFLYRRIWRFRKNIQPLLPHCAIERDTVADGYRCTGPFSSCVILPEDTHESYLVNCS